MEGQFVVKRLVESGTCTEYLSHDNNGEWMWKTHIDHGSRFDYGTAKLVAQLVRLTDKYMDLHQEYSIVRVDYYEEYIR